MKQEDLEHLHSHATREYFSKRSREWGLVLELIREFRELVNDSQTLTEYVAANAPELTPPDISPPPPMRVILGGMSKP